MKKFLLLAAAALVAGSTFAQVDNNKVVNGSFEAEGAESAVPDGYTWDPWNTYDYVTNLPGWETTTGGPWNGGIQLIEEEGDDYSRPSTDMHYLLYRAYNDNGWTSICAIQVVENLKPGLTYNFQYKVCARFPAAEDTANNYAPDPDFGFQLAEADKNAEGSNIAGKEIMKENLASEKYEGTWENGSTDFYETNVYEFVAPADGKVYLNIYLTNYYGEKNKKDSLWMCVDDVRIWSDDDEEGAGVDAVVVDANAPVEYFNLQGIRVANPENGVFIRRQGTTTSKVRL